MYCAAAPIPTNRGAMAVFIPLFHPSYRFLVVFLQITRQTVAASVKALTEPCRSLSPTPFFAAIELCIAVLSDRAVMPDASHTRQIPHVMIVVRLAVGFGARPELPPGARTPCGVLRPAERVYG